MSTPMKTIRSGVMITFGSIALPVNVASARDSTKREGNRTVCTGGLPTQDGRTDTHDPVAIKHQRHCETCAVEVPEHKVQYARPVGDRLVVIDRAALAAASKAEQYTRNVTLAAHPAPQVELGTMAAEKVYYLLPTPGAELAYAELAGFIASQPELAFVGRYAPRTAVGLYRLTTIDVPKAQPVLVLVERVLSDELRAAPVLTVVPREGRVEMATRLLKANRRALVSKFVPAAYADDTEAAVAQVVAAAAGLQSVPVAPVEADPMLEALQAHLDAQGGKKAPRKRRTVTVRSA